MKHSLAFESRGVKIALYAAALPDYTAGGSGGVLGQLDYAGLREKGVSLSAL